MDFFAGIVHNKVLITACWAWLIAQILKTLIYVIVNKDFNPERLVGDGGMPSSHSATVMALTTASAIIYGPDSFQLAISAILALIVMHDAMGVRRETGKQAVAINNMMQWLADFSSEIDAEQKLKEFVGHSPLQVFFGAVLGIIVGLVSCLL